MTQIELEAGLAQIEADYSGRVEVEAKKNIRQPHPHRAAPQREGAGHLPV